MGTATAIFAVVVMSSPLVADYQQGDIVVVVKEADLKVDTKTVGQVYPGFSLTVQKFEGGWLWVGNGVPGWLKSNNVVPLAEAVDYFSDAIKNEPYDARHFAARARVWTEKKQYDRAISDYNEAIRLNPVEATYYGSRGWANLRKNDFDRALDDCTRAINFGLNTPANYNNRGWALAAKGNYARAIADFTTAMRLQPELSYPIENLAEIFACCPDARWRNGRKAVEFGTRVNEMSRWLQPSHLHLLACANAESGQFDDAVRWEERAIKLDPPSKQSNLQAFEKALGRFKQHEPFHELVSIE